MITFLLWLNLTVKLRVLHPHPWVQQMCVTAEDATPLVYHSSASVPWSRLQGESQQTVSNCLVTPHTSACPPLCHFWSSSGSTAKQKAVDVCWLSIFFMFFFLALDTILVLEMIQPGSQLGAKGPSVEWLWLNSVQSICKAQPVKRPQWKKQITAI